MMARGVRQRASQRESATKRAPKSATAMDNDDAATQRRRIQEALQAFSDLQQVRIADAQDLDRVRASTSSAPTSKETPRGPTAAQSTKSLSKSQQESVAHLRHKVEVSEAILKKLHKKNQELTAEIDRLKSDPEPQPERRPGSAPSQQVIAALRHDVSQKEREIQELKARLLQQQPSAGLGSPRAAPAASDGKAAAELQLMRQRYDELLGSKLEFIAQGESTGKINREVKLFFSAMKHRLAQEIQLRLVDAQLASERMLEMEEKLCTRETRQLHK